MQKFHIFIEGITPLLMHSDRSVDPSDPITKAMKAITSKKTNKTDKDIEELQRLEFVAGLYINKNGPYIPDANLVRCIQDAGKATRHGQAVIKSLILDNLEIPLRYDGPRYADGLWEHPQFRNVSSVRVTNSRVMRTRPQFSEWSIETTGMLDDSTLSWDDFSAIVGGYGFVGLGDWRPRFGRFSVILEKVS